MKVMKLIDDTAIANYMNFIRSVVASDSSELKTDNGEYSVKKIKVNIKLAKLIQSAISCWQLELKYYIEKLESLKEQQE